VLNTEARTVDADVLSRRCVLMRLVDFSYEQYQKALRQSAGAVVIILPRAMAAVPQDVVRVSHPLPNRLSSPRCEVSW
jgi:hypothetical protein